MLLCASGMTLRETASRLHVSISAVSNFDVVHPGIGLSIRANALKLYCMFDRLGELGVCAAGTSAPLREG